MRVLEAKWHATAADPNGFPGPSAPEVAFLGRSNVGKSSLLNALVNRKQLARTSGTPGKTRLLHFFRIVAGELELAFVDLPGYGFAKVSRAERKSWAKLVEAYLELRQPLCLAILLQDIRRDVSEDETLLLEWLAERDVPSILVLTKADKLKPMKRKARIASLEKGLDAPTHAFLPTSSQSGDGIDRLWRQIFEMIQT